MQGKKKRAHGGARHGAGRPEVKYNTTMVRVPDPVLNKVKKIISDFRNK